MTMINYYIKKIIYFMQKIIRKQGKKQSLSSMNFFKIKFNYDNYYNDY